MADLLYLSITVAFFALAVGFVSVCDRIIGPDADHGALAAGGEPDPAEAHPEAADRLESVAGAVPEPAARS